MRLQTSGEPHVWPRHVRCHLFWQLHDSSANLSSCSRREVGFVTHCVQFLNAVCQLQGWKRKAEKLPKATEDFLIGHCVFRPNLTGKRQMIHSLSLPSWCFYDVLQTQRINTFNECGKSIALKSKEMVCIAFCPLLEIKQLIRVCLASWWFHLDGIKPPHSSQAWKTSSERVFNCGTEDD